MKNNKAKLSRESISLSAGDGKGKTIVNYGIVNEAAMILRALNHPLRKRMLEVIQSKEDITVTEIYVRLKLEQSVASQHLAILRNARLVLPQRNGKFIHYTVNVKRIARIVSVSEQLAAIK